MLDLKLKAQRPHAPAPSRLGVPTRLAFGAWAAGRLRSLASTLTRHRHPAHSESAVDELAELVTLAREPDEIRLALVRLACLASGADRAELLTGPGGRAGRRLASWPAPPRSSHPAEAVAGPRRLVADPESGGPSVLQIPLRAGEMTFGTLRLTSSRRRAWPNPVVRRIGTLCAIAAAAERGLGGPPRTIPANPGSSLDPEAGPVGSNMLGAFLTFALAQARRRAESVSLLNVAVDRLPALGDLLGEGMAEAAVGRVGRAIRATIRASDVVVRLEDGRLAVILPNATAESAARVAAAVHSAIHRTGSATESMPALSASIGFATYPDHAHDTATLRAGASSALTRAQAAGHGHVATPEGLAPPGSGPDRVDRSGPGV